ncbi:MAG: hypothetical protein JRJ45_07995 [Deltaproteobacteria bacterium]|nr:hypothetical protein [Deltaproteobacteria bacterium]
MGGRGSDISSSSPKLKESKWAWIKTVPTNRLIGYSERANTLSGIPDPQGRNIHGVGYYADRELISRGVK